MNTTTLALEALQSYLDEVAAGNITNHPNCVYDHCHRIEKLASAALEAEAVQEPVTDAMIAMYLTANTAYWKRMDDGPPKDPGKWRQGSPEEATRESLLAVFAILSQAIAQPAPQQATAPEWRPIETAPKDDTEILIHTVQGDFYVVVYDDLFSAPWRIRNSEGLNESVPTHWMPLPAAPGSAP